MTPGVDFEFLTFPKRETGFGSKGPETTKGCFAHMLPFVRKAQHILEIGTAAGWTTLNFALHCPTDAIVSTIDGNGELVWEYEMQTHPEAWKKVERFIGGTWDFDYAAHGIDNVDLAFIDGSHFMEDVVRDTVNVLKLMHEGGHIFWHDYVASAKGPGPALAIAALGLPVKQPKRGLGYMEFRKDIFFP